MNMKGALKALFLSLLLVMPTGYLATPGSAAIDQLVKKAMQTFQVPGVAVGIIKNGKVIHSRGYGLANINTEEEVNQDTIFKIASNSKAFTAAALAILVDQGKLDWNDKVIEYLPDFQTSDPWVTREFNIIDLLTHRSGLGRFAGDLMIWPEPTRFTRTDVVHNLRYLKLNSGFRSQYAYDNLLYIVAGEVIKSISGQSWEDFIATHIFKPLDMERCYGGGIDTDRISNLVATHVLIDNKLHVDTPNLINNKTSLMAAAGGIKCSVSNLLNWINMLLQDGVVKNGQQLLSVEQRDILWKSVTPLSISTKLKELEKMHYRGYALGWRVSDYHGHWTVSHTGTLSGSASKIILLPDQKLGIVILTNRDSDDARNSLYHGILQEFTTGDNIDWVDYYQKARGENEQLKQQVSEQTEEYVMPDEIRIPDTPATRKLMGYYIDPWFGKVSISRQQNTVLFQSEKSPRLKGEIFFYTDNKWWVKWDNRSFNADAWLYFEYSPSANETGLLMDAISPDADRSFDFKDLEFILQ